MHEQTDSVIKKRMVEAIKNGLYETKEEMRGKDDVVNNSLPYRKLDNIANSIIRKFHDDDIFRYVLCKRGWYIILFLYDKINKVLYSFFSEKRFNELINRKTISNLHYIDALVEFNDDLQTDRLQQVLDEDLSSKDEDKVQELKNKIITMLDNDEPQKYITVCHAIDDFRLCNVKAVITSKYLEVLEKNDWSEFIDIDYREAIFDDIPKHDLDDEVKVTLKTKLPSLPNFPDEIKIPVKAKKEEIDS
jgi:hypothetical protein